MSRLSELAVVLGALLLPWTGWAGESAAKTPTGEAALTANAPSSAVRVDFVVANTVFAVLHEFGHVVIRDFEVPLLGLEEDSADTLAAMVLVPSGQSADQVEARMPLVNMLALAAVGNALTWKTGAEKQESEIVYWAQHSLSVRRAARIACLIYGSDPQRYAWIAAGTKMPEFRRDGCPDEYAMARRGGQWVHESFGQAAPSPAGVSTGEISVIYGRTRTPAQAEVRSLLQERQILETLARFVDAQFAFVAPLTVRARVCGGPNAFWDPESREVRVCYELLEAFWQLSADPALEKAYAAVHAAAIAGQQSPGSAQSGAPPAPANNR